MFVSLAFCFLSTRTPCFASGMPNTVPPLPWKAPLPVSAPRLPAFLALPAGLLRPPASLAALLLTPPSSSPPPLSAPPPPSLSPPPPSFLTLPVPVPPLPPAPFLLPLTVSLLQSGRPGRRSGPFSFLRRSLCSALWFVRGVSRFSGCVAFGGFTCGLSVTLPRFIPQVCARTIQQYHVSVPEGEILLCTVTP